MSDTHQVSHNVSGETIVEAVVNHIVGSSSAGTNYHTVTVQDGQGNSATGHGRSESDARADAERSM